MNFLCIFCDFSSFRDDEEDGEWEAPQIDNVKCKAAGCGEWKRPSIKNPNYKGKWAPPLIANPKYKVYIFSYKLCVSLTLIGTLYEMFKVKMFHI